MKWLIRTLGQLLGIYCTPDNHVIPVLRLGRYHRVEGAHFFWIIPIIERTLPAIKTSLYVGDFLFTSVLSKDNIPFSIRVAILFTFNPSTAARSATATLVRQGEKLLLDIVKDYANQGLRRLTSMYGAEELCGGPAMSTIERNLTHFLIAALSDLGIAPLRKGGILIKETIAPEKFQRTMLNVRLHEATLRVLASYQELNLTREALQAEFVTNLEHLEGNLTLLSSLAPLEEIMPLPYDLDTYPLARRNGQNSQNGY